MSKSDIDKNKINEQNIPVSKETKIPLSHELEVKDLVNPITISRMRILQFAIAGIIGLVGLTYYYQYYIKKPSGTELVQSWIEASGGQEAWNNIQDGSFQRSHTLYADNGDVLKEKVETLFFNKVNGEFKLLSNYKTPEGIDLWLGQDQEGYWATLNDQPIDPKKPGKDLGFMCDSKWCQPDCAMKMTLYRFSMPFNLVGDGVIPSLSGIAEVNGQPSNVLEVTYRPTVGKDRWVFYADQESHLISKIEYHHKNDHGQDLPEEMYWSDYKMVDGLQIPHKWQRFWTNGNPLEVYEFSNFNFNSTLPKEFANRPPDLDWANL